MIFFFFKLFNFKNIFQLNFFKNWKFFIFILIIFFFSIFFFINYNIFFFILFLKNFNNFFFYNFFFLQFFNYSILNIYYFPFIYIFLLITFFSLIYCLTYNFNEFIIFLFYCFLILIFGFILFFTNSLIIFFLSYELLLIPSFFILYRFAKTRRCIEAAYLMFFWTQFGAIFLIFSFFYLFFLSNTFYFNNYNIYIFTSFEINFLFICWIIGFGVKLPIWPFYNWLPKAHVEASTNFSIFLSGVLVKFAFFGLFKCLLMIQLEPSFLLIYPFLLIGLLDSSFKLFYQIDLKKLVAYSTVVEMHWLTICIISGQSNLFFPVFVC